MFHLLRYYCAWVLVATIVRSEKIVNLNSNGLKTCGLYGYRIVNARFGRETFLLCLKLQAIGFSTLTNRQSALLLEPEPVEDHNLIQAFPLADVTMAYGFPLSDPASGSAEGYLGDDHQFYGVLHLGNRTLHADPYGRDDITKSFGAFENDNVAAPQRPRRHYAQFGTFYNRISKMPYSIEGYRSTPGVARSRVCDLLLLADKKFFEIDANSSLNHVVRRMVHAVAQADVIFRNADFNEDGIPDNIGFSIKYILVLTSNVTNTRVFGDLLQHHSVDGRDYLMRFARLRRLSEVCLGIAFSGHAFYNRTLGLSFTSLGGGMGGAAGGMCDRRAYGRSFNTLALAHATDDLKERVPQRIAALTLAHEMGHSFGAHHDDNFPNPECRGFLMGSQSSTTASSRQFEFSMCSKRLIAATLSSMSYCLADKEMTFCGNGIVEEGEACDCGLPSHCSQRDPCCTPRAGGAIVMEDGALHREGCSVAPTVMCHPSQGLCCSLRCEYANLTSSGIDCTSIDRVCACNVTSECSCGLGGRCLADGSCHAAECTALGLKECRCPKKGPGGELGKARRCGVCCQLKAGRKRESRCVGVEFAARDALRQARLPENWPDDDYRGPSLTLKLCAGKECRFVTVRAWTSGDYCVSMSTVGVCSPRGVCKSVAITPRINVYPELSNNKLVSQFKSSSSRLKSTIEMYLLLIFGFWKNVRINHTTYLSTL